jgi:hypothetical protein
MLISPIINFPFKFDNESLTWIAENKELIYEMFDRDFLESGGFWFNNPDTPESVNFQSTPPAKQITNFLKKLGLTKTYIHFAIYKTVPKRIGTNIETLHLDAPQFNVLPGRFNVLVDGDNDSKMHWWNHGTSSDKVSLEIIPVGKRWMVPGKNSKEQIEVVGKPDYSSESLSVVQETGSFVRTDIIHALERTGGRRFIISARIFHPWEEIYEKVNKTLPND